MCPSSETDIQIWQMLYEYAICCYWKCTGEVYRTICRAQQMYTQKDDCFALCFCLALLEHDATELKIKF